MEAGILLGYSGMVWGGAAMGRPITWKTPSVEGCNDSHSGESMNW